MGTEEAAGIRGERESFRKAAQAYKDALKTSDGLPGCEKCKAGKVVIPTVGKPETGGETQADDKTNGVNKNTGGDTTKSAGTRRRVVSSTPSILALSRLGHSAKTILARRRLICDSQDSPALRALMMKIVEANASHL